ncbi:MAG: hypothetical protein V1799_19420 [bacterium]
MKLLFFIAAIGAFLCFSGCASTSTTVQQERYTLTLEEQTKLDPFLAKLLTTGLANESEYDVSTRSDGRVEVGVIIRTNNVEELKKLGIQPGSVFGEIITARLSLAELKKVAGSIVVRSIQNSSKNIIH